MSQDPRTPLRVLALLLAPLAAARAGVIVVDAQGGGDATLISTAVAMAQPGDTILVRPGHYDAPFQGEVVIDKPLTLAADGTGEVFTLGLRVVGLAPGQVVVLRGLTADGNGSALYEGLRVESGRVVAEGCALRGKDGFFTIGAFPGTPGVVVAPGARLTLVGGSARGGRGVDSFFPYAPEPSDGGAGVVVTSGRLDAWGCEMTGGAGGDFVGFSGKPGPGGNGGDGLRGTDAVVFVSGAVLQGGAGGHGDEAQPAAGHYAGGDGADLGGSSALRRRDSVLAPGAGGASAGGPGPDGVELVLPSGDLLLHPEPHRHYALGAPTPEGGVLQLDYVGEPGDVLGVFAALAPAWLSLPGKQGTWHLAGTLFGPFLFGPVDGSGELHLAVPLGEFGLGPEDALLLHEQALVTGAGGPSTLSSPTLHLLVDGSL